MRSARSGNGDLRAAIELVETNVGTDVGTDVLWNVRKDQANLSFTDQGEEVVRMISARRATSLEREAYEETV